MARDNSGIHTCYTVNTTAVAAGLAVVLAALVRVAPAKKLRKGDLVKLVVFGVRAWVYRRGGCGVSLGYNGVVSLKKDGTPVATRVYAPVYLEARTHGYARLSVVARAFL